MRFYNHQHPYDCGIDLHVKTMYLCILDATGQVLVHRNVPSTPAAFLETVAPYRDHLVVAAEHITFVLGHALAMTAGRPRTTRLTRITSRSFCGAACCHKRTSIPRGCDRHGTSNDGDAFHRLRSVPGIGKVLGSTILYEIHDITRCDRVQEFASYARLIKCAKESAGKTLGTSGAKMGHVHLKWAFSEAAVLFLRHTAEGKKLLARLEKKHGTGKALSILAHTIGRAVYDMLSRGTVFRWSSSSRRSGERVG